jgi:hypothetical protein
MAVDNGASRILVIEERANPSTDFFVRPALAQYGIEPEYYNFVSLPVVTATEKVMVVFVRYISKAWWAWVMRHRHQISRLCYFMDDDLFDLTAFKGLPWRYQFKLTRLAYRRRQWLAQQGAELWVSTPYLQHKYAQWQPLLLQATMTMQVPEQFTLFYHGSASHQAEYDWLYPVVADVLAANAGLSFEIIGDARVNLRYRKLSRVHILHPMSWQAYQALLGRGGRDIGLAPLLENRFNRARAYTKFFDITRAGAVGLYSEDSIYQQVVQHEYNGLLLPNCQSDWCQAISGLLNEPLRIQQLHARAALGPCVPEK